MSAFLLLFACAEPDTTVDVTQFDQSCEVVEDCMAVFVGSACGCDCTSEGINVAEADNYYDLRDAQYEECTEEIPECMTCPDIDLTCDEGLCVVVLTEQ